VMWDQEDQWYVHREVRQVKTPGA